jgi:hypothetical protein
LDWRLALGVLLVVGSLLAGARIVGSAQETAQVWAVTGDLAEGTVLKPQDVRVVRVKLPESAGRYLAADRSPAGQTLSRDIGRDELLPRDALSGRQCGSRVSIPVGAQHVPATIAAGQRIDVYATVKGGETARVLRAVPVQVVQRPRAGLAGGPDWSVVVRVPPGSAAAVVRAVRTAEIDVTVVDSPASEEPCDPRADAEPSPGPSPSAAKAEGR